ncbi:hypothetical protein E2C01_033879 [Portunus trituberculatus]|uniref:Uncharacterized protein n=1 Tax=Portunus trituberculatus TaxID=210409 RepID=A0A5B7F6Z1_PORTR|nr:hypothetical protein [Portunus trituberculatus]
MEYIQYDMSRPCSMAAPQLHNLLATSSFGALEAVAPQPAEKDVSQYTILAVLDKTDTTLTDPPLKLFQTLQAVTTLRTEHSCTN